MNGLSPGGEAGLCPAVVLALTASWPFVWRARSIVLRHHHHILLSPRISSAHLRYWSCYVTALLCVLSTHAVVAATVATWTVSKKLCGNLCRTQSVCVTDIPHVHDGLQPQTGRLAALAAASQRQSFSGVRQSISGFEYHCSTI